MSIINVKRKDRHKTDREDRLHVNYFIPNDKGDEIRICLNAFSSITTINRKRLNLISKIFKNASLSLTEKRSSASITAQSIEITNSIIDHIRYFKPKRVIILEKTLTKIIYSQNFP